MTELSALGIKVTSDGVVKTTGELERFAKASNAARAAAKPINVKVGVAGLSKAASDLQKMQKAMSALGGKDLSGAVKMAQVLSKIEIANNKAAISAQNLAAATARASEAQAKASATAAASLQKTQAAQARMTEIAAKQATTTRAAAASITSAGNAARQANAHVMAYRNSMDQASRAAWEKSMSARAAANADQIAANRAWAASKAEDALAGSARRAGVALQGAGASAIKASNDVGISAGAMKANTGNIAAQFQDIGVTAAMGMNPLIIGLQQGTQLSAVFAQSGQSMGAVIAGAFRQIASAQAIMTIGLVAGVAALLQMVDWAKLAQSALLGLADVLVTIAPYAVAAAAALALIYSPAIIAGIAALTKGFVGLAAAMLACIPIPVLIVAGLTAIIAAANYWRDDLTRIFGVDIVAAAKNGINFIIGGFVGGYNAIRATWSELPAAIGDAAITAANRVIEATSGMVNRVKQELNDLFVLRNAETGESRRLFNFDTKSNLGRIANPYAGSLSRVSGIGGDQVRAAQSVDYIGNGVQRVRDLAGQAADKFREWAKALGASDDDKKKGRGGKTAAERLADLLRNAQAEITVEENRLKAVGMSARAAAELEQRTKLLNQVEKAGIPITDKLRAEIDRLAKSYANAKIAADTAIAIQGVTDTIDKQKRAIADDVAVIGLYGDDLARARKEQELLNAARDALPRGASLPEGEEERIRGEAADIAGRMSLAEIQKRDEALRKSAESAKYAMGLEREGLYLTGKEAIAHSYAMERLNAEYERAGFVSAEYAAAVRRNADVFAEQRYEIDRTREAIEESREITKGFFTDWINQVRNGGNIFKAFADSVINSLNRILDKMLDNMWQNAFAGQGAGGFFGFLGGLLGGGGGGSRNAYGLSGVGNIYAKGGAFANDNELTRFAKGGAFTNSIVSSPTLFSYANGGAFGQMGEAGPEAIMPLKRGPDGSLGVEAHGGRGVNNNVTVENTYNIGGVMTPEAIIAAIRQGGEETMRAVQRQLPTIMNEYDRNGAVAA